MTTVVNIYKISDSWMSDPEYVYIGRRGRGKTGQFGNPIQIGAICPVCNKRHMTGGDTLPCYEEAIRQRLASDPEFKVDFLALKGKKLVCFCAPRPCHGDVIVRILNEPT